MAVTCSFKEKRGSMWLKDSQGHPVKCQVWAGGNCMMVVTYGQEKALQTFFSDMTHLKRCSKDEWFKDWIAKLEIPIDLPYAKDIAAVFAKAGVPVTLFPKGHKFR